MTNLAAVAPGGACQPSHGTNGVFTQSADGRYANFFPARPITAADLATADKSGLKAGLCLGPSVDSGASGGDGTEIFRTVEPDSGMEQSRTGSNVGATRFEQPQDFTKKIDIRVFRGAESGAQSPPADVDPLLAVIVSAWPRLTHEQRIRVIEAAMVDPAAGPIAPCRDK